jgi:hypothetical protein
MAGFEQRSAAYDDVRTLPLGIALPRLLDQKNVASGHGSFWYPMASLASAFKRFALRLIISISLASRRALSMRAM